MAKITVMKGVGFTEKRLREWLRKDAAVVCQTKRDEFRCVVEIKPCELVYTQHAIGMCHPSGKAVTYTSAQGKPLFNLSCYDDFWLEVARVTGQVKFDTGVMVQNSFDLTRRTVRASKKQYDLMGQTVHEIKEKDKKTTLPDGTVLVTPGFYYKGTLKAQFWFYDLPNSPELYRERRALMACYHRNFPEHTGIPETEVVMLTELNSKAAEDQAVADVNQLFSIALEYGHEGLMVKRFEHPYKEGRSTDWMKKKPEDEVDGEVVGFTEGKDGFAGMVGSIECRAEDGSTFSVSGFNMELRQQLTADRDAFMGRWLEARFMQRDSAGGYRHPRFYRWHPDK